jgi:hypothetical protein
MRAAGLGSQSHSSSRAHAGHGQQQLHHARHSMLSMPAGTHTQNRATTRPPGHERLHDMLSTRSMPAGTGRRAGIAGCSMQGKKCEGLGGLSQPGTPRNPHRWVRAWQGVPAQVRSARGEAQLHRPVGPVQSPVSSQACKFGHAPGWGLCPGAAPGRPGDAPPTPCPSAADPGSTCPEPAQQAQHGTARHGADDVTAALVCVCHCHA